MSSTEPLITPASRPNLLLVEDDEILSTMIANFLRGRGYHVAVAREAEEAAALLELRRHDVLITDLGLDDTGMEGFDLIAQARYRWPRMRILVLSGKSDPETVAKCRLRGATVFLGKPVPLRVLAAALAGLLGRDPDARPVMGPGSSSACGAGAPP
ncbi:MAG: response regulator [Thermoanaerobaculia bacterium]|nr:response regulator [Thermoanaerobaculia bacterium]